MVIHGEGVRALAAEVGAHYTVDPTVTPMMNGDTDILRLRISAGELEKLADLVRGLGAELEFNILSRSLYFLEEADLAVMWPERSDVSAIAKFLRDTLKRPGYEVDYVNRYYSKEAIAEPACVLGYTQVFVVSNGDVLTGCYPLKPVGNILRQRLENILKSQAYVSQCVSMVRRECPGCTCGVETSLAMKHAAASAFFHLDRLKHGATTRGGGVLTPVASADSPRP